MRGLIAPFGRNQAAFLFFGWFSVIRESKFFNIRHGEFFPLLMAALGTFLSIASVVLGRTLSDAVLLSARPAINVANFFILSSFALMAVSLVYFRLIRAVSAVILNASILVLFGVAVLLFESIDRTSHTAVLTYATFLTTAPALANIIVWNAIGDAFNARQGRRLFHLVCAASTCGGIAAGFLIPPLIEKFGILALSVSDASVFLLMALPVLLLHRYRRSEKTHMSFSGSGETRQSLRQDFISAINDIAKSPLLKSLSIVFFLTAIATNVIDFTLKYYLQTNYDQDGIAMFYGHFNAISNLFNLIVQLTLLSQFLTRFRTRTLFAITPVILLLFTVPFVFVYSAAFIIAIRFTDVALRFTIQDAAREIAISPLPRLLRNRAKVIFKGVMNPLGGMFAGLLLNATAPILDPQYTPLLLLPVIAITLFFVRNLNRYSANHLLEQLGASSHAEDNHGAARQFFCEHWQENDESKSSPEPEQLLDGSGVVRDATMDYILSQSQIDPSTSAIILRHGFELVSREARLAQALIVWMQSLEDYERADESSTCDIFARIEGDFQNIYDGTIHRLFKALMILYNRRVIDTVYKSLAASRSSTRAQALELLQLTLTSCPCAKHILVLCDDLDREEKYVRLDAIEPLSQEAALGLLIREEDRQIQRVIRYLRRAELLPDDQRLPQDTRSAG
ncbi:MAG: hypothetical protein FWC40_01665 [Proteobacteria bacterium]|nr:hypothetical protein [Pseudomonadota bacterium]